MIRRVLLSVVVAIILAAGLSLFLPLFPLTGSPIPPPSEKATPRATRTRHPTKTPTQKPIQTATTFLSATPKPAQPFTPTVQAALPFSTLTPTLGGPAIPTTLPTRTAVPPTPAPTKPPPLELDCKLIWQSPPNGSTYDMGTKFSVGWNIKNIGTVTWDPGSFEFTYLGGARLATHDFNIPLQQSVPPGQEIVLSVPMKTPLTVNMFTTHWGIRTGDKFFCRLTLTIWAQ